MKIITIAAIGILLGLRHALDADHLAAVATIVTRERSLKRAAWIGALWGVGHSISVMLVGGAIVAFRLVVPPRLGLGLELGVAAMLIFLGYRNMVKPHTHDHEHGDPGRRPLLVGIVHGLAGSAAAALLVLTTIQNTAAALTYLLVFCLGTMAGMTIVTGMMAAPSIWAHGHHHKLQHGIRLAAGVASLVLGVILVREIVVTNGLFSAAPTWTPR